MKFYKKYINNIFYKLFITIINFYQKIISPVIPARCRYYPTCSNYGKHALAWYGVRSGSWLLLKRLGRCQPWGGHGIDFVPLPLHRYRYKLVSNSNYLKTSGRAKYLFDKNIISSVYCDNSSYAARLNYLMSQS